MIKDNTLVYISEQLDCYYMFYPFSTSFINRTVDIQVAEMDNRVDMEVVDLRRIIAIFVSEENEKLKE